MRASSHGLVEATLGPGLGGKADWYSSFFVIFEEAGGWVLEVDAVEVATWAALFDKVMPT